VIPRLAADGVSVGCMHTKHRRITWVTSNALIYGVKQTITAANHNISLILLMYRQTETARKEAVPV